MAMQIIGISGSLRKDSFNTALLRAGTQLAPESVELQVTGVHGIPLFNADEESAHGLPEAVVALKEQIAASDALILATPEYNNGIPGVFKNAIDWLSRPGSDIPRVFGGKPVALMGASPGGFGTILSQNAWLPVLRSLGTDPWFGSRLLVSRAGSVFDDQGAIADEKMNEQIAKFLNGFSEFVTSR